MKRNQIAVVALVALAILVLAYIWFAPAQGGQSGSVHLVVIGFQTNSAGVVSAQVQMTNAGNHTVRIAIGVQTLKAGEWVDAQTGRQDHTTLTIHFDPLLPTDPGRILSVAFPTSSAPYRIFGIPQRDYADRWTGRFRWLIDAYVLKRKEMEWVYSKEFQR
jgi:hypothetical protein